jgi:hypothetical protein
LLRVLEDSGGILEGFLRMLEAFCNDSGGILEEFYA